MKIERTDRPDPKPPRAAPAIIAPKESTNGHTTEAKLRELWAETSGPCTPKPIWDETGRNEVENARRFVFTHGYYLRYVEEWRRWVVWDGTRWKEDEGDVYVRQRAIVEMIDLWEEAKDYLPNHQQAKQIMAFAKESNSRKTVDNVVSLARSVCRGTAVSAKTLDKDAWLLNVVNGTIDLQTGDLRRHDPHDLITKLCPTRYDQDAKCPTWIKFLAAVFSEKKELIAYLQRLLGYCITGNVREQILPIFWGDGSNGKGTLCGALKHILGDDFFGAPPKSLFVASKYGNDKGDDLLELQGKRLGICQETEQGALLNESLIKQLTGGDPLTGRRNYDIRFTTFDPTHKLILSTNKKPVIIGRDYAIWRRVKLIPFLNTFSKESGNLDESMGEKLVEGFLGSHYRKHPREVSRKTIYYPRPSTAEL